jgi:hypothetical protein
MKTLWGREPAMILAAVQAVIALAVGFGLPVSPAQVALIVAFTAAALGVVTRSQVSPAAPSPPQLKRIAPIPGTTLPNIPAEPLDAPNEDYQP